MCEDKKLRGVLQDPRAVEAAITAVQIASLRRVGKGSKGRSMQKSYNNTLELGGLKLYILWTP